MTPFDDNLEQSSATRIQLFIPEGIRRLRVADSSASPQLLAALRKLRIQTFGDLSGVYLRHFQRVSKAGTILFLEVGNLIRCAREENSTSPGPVALRAQRRTIVHFGSSQQKSAATTPCSLQLAAQKDSAPTNQSQQIPLGTTFIPLEMRGRPISTFPMSVRLMHILDAKGIRICGEMHGLVLADFQKFRNCGKKTMTELQELVRQLQSGYEDIAASYEQPTLIAPSLIVVPPTVSDLKFSELPMSVRLENVLQKRGYHTLGELNNVDVQTLLAVKNCGKKCILELRKLIHRACGGEFSPIKTTDLVANLREVSQSIDSAIANLPKRDREIYEARLFGDNGNPQTLEEIGSKFKMTRERVRQIVRVVGQTIRRGGGPKLGRALEVIANECKQRVCPLTPELFAEWLGSHALAMHSAQFYVCVLDHIDPAIPAWPPRSIRDGDDDLCSVQIEDALEAWMRPSGLRPALAAAYAGLRRRVAFDGLSVSAFLGAIRVARRVIVNFPTPNQPELQLRRIRMRIREFAVPVLTDSPGPLLPEEIVEQAKARYGEDAVVVSARGAANSLTSINGFFLLGPRSYGLRQHFQTPASRRPILCDQFQKVLESENRPVSTIEAVAHKRIKGFEKTNHYEIAEILREDSRFSDLGRHLFALVEWGVQEREYVKDLVTRVFTESNQALTVEQTLKRLTRLRSVSPYSITNVLQKHSEICSYGFGYYGLKSWGSAQKEIILRDRATIERAVRRAAPPVSFAGLCATFGVSSEGPQADMLWKGCAGSSQLRRAPDMQSSETLLLHKSVSLEQALASIARALQRPAPAYELQWELSAKFGEIFVRIGLGEIEKRLNRSERFIRNAAGDFIFDEDLDWEDFDAEALRAASVKSLSESRDVANCEELIDRLEAQGFDLDEVSADILASILRGAEGLQEIGDQRFRAKL